MMTDDRDIDDKFRNFEEALTEALHAIGNVSRHRTRIHSKDITSALRELLVAPASSIVERQVEPDDKPSRAPCECKSPKMTNAPDGGWHLGDDYICTLCKGVVTESAQNYRNWHTGVEIASVLQDCYTAAYEPKGAPAMQAALGRAVCLLRKLDAK